MKWIKKNWRWVLITVIAYIAIYLVIPKYYFKIDVVETYKTKQVTSITCNRVTGNCKVDIIYEKKIEKEEPLDYQSWLEQKTD